MTDERTHLCDAIAATIAEYRADEVAAPRTAHVERWVAQFDAPVQIPLLRELDHVLERTYFSRARVEAYLRSLLRHDALVGPDPASFWRSVSFLALQAPGRSQGEMVAVFGELLQDEFELSIDECGEPASTFLYLDDGVFSGTQISRDLSRWIEDECPARARVDVVCLALHRGGTWNAIRPDGSIAQAQAATGKQVDLRWWHKMRIENRRSERDRSDVLAPTSLPDEPRVREYAASLRHPLVFRTGESVGGLRLFSSAEGRSLLEQQLLKAGMRIRDIAPNLNGYQRPLGYSRLQTLGFGSLIVTHRNCPNNAPLALWVDDPWYPLFPRRTN